MLYLGWILAAFLGGFLLAYCLRERKRHGSLRARFLRVEAFQGRSYREVLRIAGVKPDEVIPQADGTTRRVWREEGYFIVLAFDGREVCLGVVDEQI